MIEDQLAPKRCGHTRGKQVVERAEAFARIRAAVDARDAGTDVLVMARTDARATHGVDEALFRAQAFADLGADLIFVEAPTSEAEMAADSAARVAAPMHGQHARAGVDADPAARSGSRRSASRSRRIR